MNNNQVKQIIQGIGAMVEMWTIAYKGFKQQGLTEPEATTQTTAFMSVMMNDIFNQGGDK